MIVIFVRIKNILNYLFSLKVKWIEATSNESKIKPVDGDLIEETLKSEIPCGEKEEFNDNLGIKNPRLKYASELIRSIRFMCMSAEELADYVEPVEFMKNLPECKDILMNAYRYHASVNFALIYFMA